MPTPTIAPTNTSGATPTALAPTPAVLPTSAVIPGTPFADLGPSWTGFQWSPTGEWLLVRRGNYVSLIRTSDMSLVRKYEVPSDVYGNSVDWIDSDSFFLYSSGTTSGLSGKAWRSSVASADLIQTDIPLDEEDNLSLAQGLTNGLGAIAYTTGDENDDSCGTYVCPRFRVWSAGATSDEVKGWPVAWSLDGTRLAVVRPLPQVGTVSRDTHVAAAGTYYDYGWLEVLTYPELQPVYSNRDVHVADIDMEFSPSGRYLLVESTHDEVLDLQTQKLTQAPADWPIYWYGDDELITSEGRDLVAYALDGSVVQRWDDMGDGPLAASADGTLVVTTDHDSAPTAVNIVRDGQAASFPLPSLPHLSGVDRVFPTPADNGRWIVLETDSTDIFRPLLVLQIPG